MRRYICQCAFKQSGVSVSFQLLCGPQIDVPKNIFVLGNMDRRKIALTFWGWPTPGFSNTLVLTHTLQTVCFSLDTTAATQGISRALYYTKALTGLQPDHSSAFLARTPTPSRVYSNLSETVGSCNRQLASESLLNTVEIFGALRAEIL